MKLTRRQAVIGAVGVFGAAAGAGPSGANPCAPNPTDIVHLQIVAHPDDDLYFFNPDLLHAIRSRHRVVTICLTGGEADGKNMQSNDKGFDSAPAAYLDYVAARYNGLRAAYAHQLLETPISPWAREKLVLANGFSAELTRLRRAPHVELVFLNMWQEGERSPNRQPARLRRLWLGETTPQPTMTPTGSPVTDEHAYSREGLIDTLALLLERYQPSVIRTMDPDPDYQRHDADNPQYSDYGDFSDHIDHTPAGLFAWAAIHRWWENGQGRNAIVTSYRGYFNRRWPSNLSAPAGKEKLKYLVTYGGGNRSMCGDPAGCGDLKVGNLKSLRGFGQGTSSRYDVSTTWMKPGADGKLSAFAVVGGRVRMWNADRVASGFPLDLFGSGQHLVPHLAVAAHEDNRWHLFGVRMTLAADPQAQYRDLVTTVQEFPGGPFGEWTVLGNPNQNSAVRRRGIGMPVAVTDGEGRLMVFVRNFFGGVSTRTLMDGQWSEWADLGGGDTRDGLAVATTASGRIELFISTKIGVRRFYQERLGASFVAEDLPMAEPAGPPSICRMPAGNLMLFVREADTAAIMGYHQIGPDASWNPQPRRMETDGGIGPIAVQADASGALMVAYRNDRGRVSASLRSGHDLALLGELWEGTEIHHAPAVAFDRSKSPVVAGLTAGGDLNVAQMTIGRVQQ